MDPGFLPFRARRQRSLPCDSGPFDCTQEKLGEETEPSRGRNHVSSDEARPLRAVRGCKPWPWIPRLRCAALGMTVGVSPPRRRNGNSRRFLFNNCPPSRTRSRTFVWQLPRVHFSRAGRSATLISSETAIQPSLKVKVRAVPLLFGRQPKVLLKGPGTLRRTGEGCRRGLAYCRLAATPSRQALSAATSCRTWRRRSR